MSGNSGKTRNVCHLFKLKLLETFSDLGSQRKKQEALRTSIELTQGQKVRYPARDHQCWLQVVPWCSGDGRLLSSLPASDLWHCVAL